MNYSLNAQSHEFGSQVWVSVDGNAAHDVRVPQNHVPYFNSTTLGAFIPANLLTTAGHVEIYVKNPLDTTGGVARSPHKPSCSFTHPPPHRRGVTSIPSVRRALFFRPRPRRNSRQSPKIPVGARSQRKR